eukprot:UN03388
MVPKPQHILWCNIFHVLVMDYSFSSIISISSPNYRLSIFDLFHPLIWTPSWRFNDLTLLYIYFINNIITTLTYA